MAASIYREHDELMNRLEEVVPQGVKLKHYYISTIPTPCPALFVPPPDTRPENTFCESHFLNFTIPTTNFQDAEAEVAIFAVEVLIYHTAKLTTLFVSKADSTGYASLLNLPKQQPSLLQAVTSEFMSWLVQNRTRSDRKLVISLFARAQDQYLFPGSIENGKKHVLDDRRLIRWWCKTLDPVLRHFEPEPTIGNKISPAIFDAPISKGFLIVPGQDKHETAAFFPPSPRSNSTNQQLWVNAHPLLQLSNYPSAPPRCLVPHFPDDPKARYLVELDEELPDHVKSTSTSKSTTQKCSTGEWKSIRSLDQFWEMMAYRQECSSGRLVGFIWVVITPCSTLKDLPSPVPSFARPVFVPPPRRTSMGSKPSRRSPSRNLKGPIHPRTPRVKNSESTTITDPEYRLPPSSIDPDFPPFSFTSGHRLVDAKAYDRLNDFLLCLDFANLDVAVASTRKWVTEMGVCVGIDSDAALASGISLIGRCTTSEQKLNTTKVAGDGMNILSVKRKKKAEDCEGDIESSNGINMLGAGLVRKKSKVAVS